MHKKPVLQGGDSGTRRPSRPGATALRAVAGRRTAALAVAVAVAVGLGGNLGPGSARAEGDPIAPASEPSVEPAATPPAAAAKNPAGDAATPSGEPAQAAPPAASQSPAATEAAPAKAAPAGLSAGSLEVNAREDRFRDLERRTFELKDQVFRAKARLTLLSETLVSANVGTTRAVIVHKNQMGPLFQPIRVSYQIDGREVFTKEDPAGVIGTGKEFVAWEGGLPAGEHTVGVTVVYRGNGAKVLSYYDKYNFTARAAHRLSAVEGQTTRLLVRCFEKGTALTAKVEDRPDFEFKLEGGAAKSADARPTEKRPDPKPVEAKAK